LSKPLRYFRILARFAFLATLVMMFTTLQLPAFHHTPFCDGDAEDVNMMLNRIGCEERVW